MKKEKEAVDRDRFKKLMDYSLNNDLHKLDGMLAGIKRKEKGHGK